MRAPAQIELQVVAVKKPEDLNLILGQSHFIKTVEDLHEALAGRFRACGWDRVLRVLGPEARAPVG